MPAAGQSRRAGTTTSKLLTRLGPRPLLWYTLQGLHCCPQVRDILLVVRKEDHAAIARLCQRAPFPKTRVVSPGGRTRQDSVWIGLQNLNGDSPLVVVHDAARPFLPLPLLRECLRQAALAGAAIAAVPCSDTLKATNALTIRGTLSREGLWLAQTPQVFRRDLLVRAHQRARRRRYSATDDAALVERLGHPVRVVPSSALNLKVTTAADLQLACLFAQNGRRLGRLLGW